VAINPALRFILVLPPEITKTLGRQGAKQAYIKYNAALRRNLREGGHFLVRAVSIARRRREYGERSRRRPARPICRRLWLKNCGSTPT